MASATVVLRGRFKPGTQVRLVRVAHEGVLRSEGGVEVGVAKVDDDGCVKFSTQDPPGSRYFLCAYVDGTYLEVRARGRAPGDESEVLEQAPVGHDRVKLSDGSFLDEPPEQHQEVPAREVSPHLGQHQVPKGTVQRSDTPRGSAHPVDLEAEHAPYLAQEDVPKGTVQASDTETGRATRIVPAVVRQEDMEGVLQRSDTETGTTTPIPVGNAVKVQRDKESSFGKEVRGEPGRVSAEPLEHGKAKKEPKPEKAADKSTKAKEK